MRISAIRRLFTVCLQEGLDIVAYARPAVTCHYFAESLDKKVMSAHNHKGESFQAYVCLIPDCIHEAGCQFRGRKRVERATSVSDEIGGEPLNKFGKGLSSRGVKYSRDVVKEPKTFRLGRSVIEEKHQCCGASQSRTLKCCDNLRLGVRTLCIKFRSGFEDGIELIISV